MQRRWEKEKREKRKWRPLLSPFFYLEIGLDGLAARLKTRGVTVFTQFLSIALRGRVRQISKQVFKPGHMLGYR